MIDQATIDKIRRLRRQGSVLKNIATMCNVSLNTVKKYVKDMDICYTDTWLDMEFFNDPAYQDKKKELMDKMMPYQLNDEFLEGSHALVFHDMPMHVGFEISKDVEMKNLDHILDQAENRRHAEKAVMYTLIKGI